MDDILAKMAAETEDDGPSPDQLQVLRQKCDRLVALRKDADETEHKLKEMKKQIWDLESKEIPDYATEIGVDRVGLPDWGVDIIVEPYCKANIAATWDEERKQRAFDHLSELGVGDIVRTSVSFTLGRDSLELALRVSEAVQDALCLEGVNNIPTPEIGMSVPWNTLTSTVRELIERGEAVDLERVGATVGQRARIKERKE